MSHKVKSALYFASLLLAVVTYHSFNTTDALQNTQVVENTMELESDEGALN